MLEIGRSAVRDHPRWVEVSPDRPCPICRAEGACSVLEEQSEAHCVNTPSGWPTLSGGWLHSYADAIESC
jgi:hypothetical protein